VIPIGEIVRLQVQAASLKVGQAPRRRYDPSPLRVVPALTLDHGGVWGWTEAGEAVPDVHHRDHPASKQRDGLNGVSIGFTGHYAAMRARFGGHLADGIAGENILVESNRVLGEDDLGGELVVVTGEGERVHLGAVLVAAPCVEFARYALRFPEDARPDPTVTEALRFLDDGMRGYYASYRGPEVRIRVGDRVFVPVAGVPPGHPAWSGAT
jgi:hypothetical protein